MLSPCSRSTHRHPANQTLHFHCCVSYSWSFICDYCDVSNTRNFDHGLTHVRHHDILHWLDVPERVTFKLCMTIYKCLHGIGPIYLLMCRPSSSEAGRRHLCSAKGGQLVVPRHRLATAGRRALSCAGPSAWNSLPEYMTTVDTLTLILLSVRLNVFRLPRTDIVHV